MTVRGVGLILAVVIALEVGDVTARPASDGSAQTSTTTSSGPSSKRPTRSASGAGAPPTVTSVVSTSASPGAKATPKAIGAVARHLAEATYWILSKQEPYREPQATAVSSTRDKRG